jgi:hypothetical protein
MFRRNPTKYDKPTEFTGQKTMGNIQSYKELKVWQDAMNAAMEIYTITGTFPAEEKYSLVDQIRRSSRSVAAVLNKCRFTVCL